MGADIYLRSKSEACRAEWEPKFYAAVEARNACPEGPERERLQEEVSAAYDAMYSQGYFRDSYNSTSLFWLLGLSWWENDYMSPGGKMKLRGMRKLLAKLEGTTITDGMMRQWQTKNEDRAVIKPYGQNSLSAWKAMFERKQLDLINLLKEAIELKEPLDCSC